MKQAANTSNDSGRGRCSGGCDKKDLDLNFVITSWEQSDPKPTSPRRAPADCGAKMGAVADLQSTGAFQGVQDQNFRMDACVTDSIGSSHAALFEVTRCRGFKGHLLAKYSM